MAIENGLTPEEAKITDHEDTELVEDVEKARVMAEAGDASRTRAASSRKKYNDRSYHGSLRDNFKQMLDYNERDADKLEVAAGKAFDLRKSVEGMSVESLTTLADEAMQAEEVVREKLEKLKQDLVSANEEEKSVLQEQLLVVEKDWDDASLKVHVLNKIISERK